MMNFKGQQFISSITIKNPRARELTLCLEPWGDEISLPPGATYRIQITGPTGDNPCVELADFGAAVYAWSGSTMTVHDGERLVRNYQTKVPPLPKK